MKTTIKILLVIFAVFLVGFSCGCISPPDNYPLKAEITFDIPKTSLVVGEKLEGEYFVKSNSKDAFFIIESRGKEGYEGKCFSQEIGMDEIISKNIRAYEITDNERACSEYSLPSFKTPGNYTFEVRVYDYSQVRKLIEGGYSGDDVVNTKANPDAKTNAKVNAIITQVPPLATMKKIVTVTEVVAE